MDGGVKSLVKELQERSFPQRDVFSCSGTETICCEKNCENSVSWYWSFICLLLNS